MSIISKDYHIKGTKEFKEVKLGDTITPENCVTVEVVYKKNLNPKGYYIQATKHGKGIDEFGSYYQDIIDFTTNRIKYVLVREAGRQGEKAKNDAIAVFNEKALEVAQLFGLEVEENAE